MTSYSWASAASSNWSTGAKWTPGGGPPTASDTATIAVTGAAYTVQVNSADAASGLTLSSANADLQILGAAGLLSLGAFAMSGGKVDVATSGYASGKLSVTGAFALSSGTVNVNNGGVLALSGTLTETGGTINLASGGTISGGTIKKTAGTINWSGGTLSGVTYQGTLDLSANNATVYLANGTQVENAAGTGAGTINDTGYGSNLYFDNTETLSNATVNLGNASYYSNLSQNDTTGDGAVLTLASTATIDVSNYAQIKAGNNVGDSIVNDGAIDYSGSKSLFDS